jgi:hypothetical protein
MSEKPKKRLVGWKQYIQTTAIKGGAYSLSAFCLCSGLLALLLSVLILCLGYFWSTDGPFGIAWLVWGGFIAAFGVVAIWGGKALFDKAKAIEPVAPITRHNTGSLPTVETLLRASVFPPSHQQADLLRAAGQGAETPPEQLLRAAREDTQDV